MKTNIRLGACWAVLIVLLAASCTKQEKPEMSDQQAASTSSRIIEPVTITNGKHVLIPMQKGDSVRRVVPSALPSGAGRKSNNADGAAMLNCEPGLSLVSSTGTHYEFFAYACSPYEVGGVTWYIIINGTQHYVGNDPSGATSYIISVPKLCGATYQVKAIVQYWDPNILDWGYSEQWTNVHWSAHMHLNTGVGAVGDGADVKIIDVNNNGNPDLMFMAYDDAPGANTFRYYIKMDVGATGNSTTQTTTKIVTGMGNEGHGAGFAVEDINYDGQKDLILMAYDDGSSANTFRYRVGYSLDANGDVAYWSQNYIINGVGNIGDGAGIALYDIDQNGAKDMVLMGYDDPSGGNTFRYIIGWNLNSNGLAMSWSPAVIVNGVGDHGQGAGIDIRDIDNNGFPEFFLMAYDDAPGINSFKYRVIHNVNASGIGTVNPNVVTYPGAGADGYGAGIALGFLNGNSTPDLIMMAYDNTPGNSANTFRYYVGYDLYATALGYQPASFYCAP